MNCKRVSSDELQLFAIKLQVFCNSPMMSVAQMLQKFDTLLHQPPQDHLIRDSLELDDETEHDATDDEDHNGERKGYLPPHLVAPHRDDHCHEAGGEEDGDVDEEIKPKTIIRLSVCVLSQREL